MDKKGFSTGGIMVILGLGLVSILAGGAFWYVQKKSSGADMGAASTTIVAQEQPLQEPVRSQYDGPIFDDSDVRVQSGGNWITSSKDCYGVAQISVTDVNTYAKYMPSKESNIIAKEAVQQYAGSIDKFLSIAKASSTAEYCTNRAIISLAIMKGAILAIDKQTKESQKVFSDLLFIAQKMQEIPNGYVIYNTSISIKLKVIDILTELKQQKIINPADYRSIIQKYVENKEGEKNTIKIEYTKQAKFIDDLVNKNYAPYIDTYGNSYFSTLDKERSEYTFEPNNTKQLFYRLAKKNIADVEKPCGETFTNDIEQLDLTEKKAENYIGKTIYYTQAMDQSGTDNKSRCDLEKKFKDF